MITSDPLALINGRRSVIRQRVKELRAEVDTLVAEEGELDAAERVFLRLAPEGAQLKQRLEDLNPSAFDGGDDDDAADSATSTVPGMITTIINEVYQDGHRGVTGSEIFASIRKRWRPEIKTDSVRPVIWRLAKADRIKKRGKFYYPVSAGDGSANGAAK
jgi:hypothetical protein